MVRMRCREEQAPVGGTMGECIVSLRGWHPALAQAELNALFPEGGVKQFSSPRLAQISTELDNKELSVAAGIEAVFQNGVNTLWIDERTLLDEIEFHLTTHPHDGASCAVHAWKHGTGIAECSRTVLAGNVGGILSRMGASIDLEHPERTFGILLDSHSQSVTFGWLTNNGPRGDSSIERRASQRPFFKPVSLEPRLARLAVNLACGPVSNGACLDPMTGTGGFTIEAVLSQRNAIGMDLDAEMIEGARRNLEWAGSDVDPFVQGDATSIRESLPENGSVAFSGVVLDPPYGRNSHGSIGHSDLLEKTLASAADVTMNGLVLILPSKPQQECLNRALERSERPDLKHYTWQELEEILERTAWIYQDAWYVAVHGSLGRVLVYATKASQDLLAQNLD
tara:strand:+ start:2034 stop:3221 length:1188 start_codon:yes stop_codon:yes gene_type:complete